MHRPATLLLLAVASLAFAAETVYQKPPKAVLDVLDAAPPPTLSVSPSRDYVIVMESLAHPPIAEIARPMLRLAGIRIDINSNGPHLIPHNISYTLKKLSDGSEKAIALPRDARLSAPLWSPDGKQFAFTDTSAHSIDLWLGTTATGQVHQVSGLHVNAVIQEFEGQGPGARGSVRSPMEWLADNRTLLVRTIPAGRGSAPEEPVVPKGPHVQESLGHAGPVATFEDMLNNPHDEDLFDFYATTQLAFVDTASSKVTPAGKPAIFTQIQPSPDGQSFLISRIHRPYSYLHTYRDFPTEVEVWDRSANKLFTVASLPMADRVPIEGVRTGPRAYQWIPSESAALLWVEAMDGGNPKEKVPHRDRIVTISAPFKGEPKEVFQTEQRFRGLQPLEKGMAFVEDFDRTKRWMRTIEFDINKPGGPGKVIFSRNQNDRYKDPGAPVMRTLPNGRRVVMQTGDDIYLIGVGASPQGDRPFVDRYNLATGKSERIFQSQPGSYEVPEAILDDRGAQILTRRESPTEPPNYFIRTGSDLKALTHYKDPSPQVRLIKKELVKYKRADGVPLSFTLYLPPNYQAGTKLPTLLWAYPYDFIDADTASQVTGSPDRFPTLTGHLLMALHGYAILDNAGMPIIGDAETFNATFIDQIVMDSKAAIDKAVEMGVTDRERVAVGGHSYGAFMTMNLLSHCDLFHAGLAESGAYNRTLTPFGFQTERRTFWEATDTYLKMSPFMSANKIKAPILMIHGEADDNTGTFPIQSERMYAAIRGNGGTVRLVMLPLEAHGYAARETLEHVMSEEINWLDKNLKTPGELTNGTR
jgi:dipeptidyl aminopeptidase/acylaminoacyl peptidase